MGMNDSRWEYSSLAKAGDFIWKKLIDPALCSIATDETQAWMRVRMLIQLLITAALVAIVIGFFWQTSHMLTASGLLFDMAGVLRLFLAEEVTTAFEPFKEREPMPSVAMREMIMPESPPFDASEAYIHHFWYRRRGMLFLFLGFVLQMIGDLI